MNTYQTIDAKTAQEWVKNKEAILIDVREPFEYEASHISGVHHIPLKEIKAEDLAEFKNKKIIIHCHLGGRSAKACQMLHSTDPDLKLYNLEGGITAWEQSGLKTVKPSSSAQVISIDRQVQLTIGTGVLIGTGLGYFVHPGFLLLAAFFGAGLVFAGSTGSCTLARIMSNMPWNK